MDFFIPLFSVFESAAHSLCHLVPLWRLSLFLRFGELSVGTLGATLARGAVKVQSKSHNQYSKGVCINMFYSINKTWDAPVSVFLILTVYVHMTAYKSIDHLEVPQIAAFLVTLPSIASSNGQLCPGAP